MENKTYLDVEFRLDGIIPWTVIFKTTDLNELIFVYKALTKDNKDNSVKLRCSVVVDGRWVSCFN